MICLTGDIHHRMRGAKNQECFSEQEMELGYKYQQIANSYGLKVTFFLTGKVVREEESSVIDKMFNLGNLEVGGHTYSALRPRLLHSFFRLATGTVYGPKFYQKFDIERTIGALRTKINQPVASWRTHGYSSDRKTLDLLGKSDIRVITDDVNPNKMRPEKVRNNLFSLPINVIPDHEHLYHGDRTRSQVDGEIDTNKEEGFPSISYSISKYFEVVKSQIERIQKNDGLATILLHPSCMKVADNFVEFGKFCKWLDSKGYKTIYASEGPEYFDSRD